MLVGVRGPRPSSLPGRSLHGAVGSNSRRARCRPFSLASANRFYTLFLIFFTLLLLFILFSSFSSSGIVPTNRDPKEKGNVKEFQITSMFSEIEIILRELQRMAKAGHEMK